MPLAIRPRFGQFGRREPVTRELIVCIYALYHIGFEMTLFVCRAQQDLKVCVWPTTSILILVSILTLYAFVRSFQNPNFQTTRGRAFNAHDLDNMRLLQKMMHNDNNNNCDRQCGGQHTTVIPLNNSYSNNNNNNNNRPCGKVLPMMNQSDNKNNNNKNNVSAEEKEVDIEGLDGRLYRGLINK